MFSESHFGIKYNAKILHGQNLLNYSTRKMIASSRLMNKTKSNKYAFRNVTLKLPQCTPICNRVSLSYTVIKRSQVKDLYALIFWHRQDIKKIQSVEYSQVSHLYILKTNGSQYASLWDTTSTMEPVRFIITRCCLSVK